MAETSRKTVEAQAVAKQAIDTQIVGQQTVQIQTGVAEERLELRLPHDLKAFLLLGIFIILFFCALYVLGEVVVPIIVAFMLSMAIPWWIL